MSAVGIEVRESEGDPHEYFRYEVTDVTPLNCDPWDVAWEAVIADEVVGMLAVEFFGSPSLVRLAVREEHRRQGVATELVEHAMEDRDEWYAYVDRDNDACQSLLESLGFVEGGYAPPPNLVRYNWARNDCKVDTGTDQEDGDD